MSAKLEIDDADLKRLLEPILAAAGSLLADQLVRVASAMAEDRTKGLMSKKEAADYLGQGERTIENWMRPEGQGGRGLPHTKIGETVIFLRSRIELWLLANERNSPPLLRPLEAAA